MAGLGATVGDLLGLGTKVTYNVVLKCAAPKTPAESMKKDRTNPMGKREIRRTRICKEP